jgi:hypothetical protein
MGEPKFKRWTISHTYHFRGEVSVPGRDSKYSRTPWLTLELGSTALRWLPDIDSGTAEALRALADDVDRAIAWVQHLENPEAHPAPEPDIDHPFWPPHSLDD